MPLTLFKISLITQPAWLLALMIYVLISALGLALSISSVHRLDAA
jgi:hypothetical protein